MEPDGIRRSAARVEYCISSHGESVRPIIAAVRLWGREHLEWICMRADVQADADCSGR